MAELASWLSTRSFSLFFHQAFSNDSNERRKGRNEGVCRWLLKVEGANLKELCFFPSDAKLKLTLIFLEHYLL